MDQTRDIKREKVKASPDASRTLTNNQKDPAEIRSEIEQTRADMSETIHAIEERLSPEHIKEQVRERVRNATVGRAKEIMATSEAKAKEYSSTIMETIKHNPIPAAMVGIGIGWLIMKRPDGRAQRYRGLYSTDAYPSRQDYGQRAEEFAGEAKEKAGEFVSSTKERAGEFAASTREKASEIAASTKEKAEQLTAQAKEKASEISSMAQERAVQAKDKFQDVLHDNPLAIGAAALALGAIVGLAIPESRRERELMGAASADLKERAKGVAQETMQKVQNVAERSQGAIKEEARKEGLTS